MSPQTVLITGCSDNGIGSALGKVLQQRGYHVFAAARNLTKMTWLKGLPNVTPIILDITKAEHIQSAVKTVSEATGGKLDHLINNAARNHFMPILDEDLDNRSIEIAADTLRLELVPLGVNVLAVVTGGVKTAGQTYFDNLRLPENSLYRSVEKTIISRAQGHDGMDRMDAHEYANAVADEIEKRTAGKFWYGVGPEMVKNAFTNVALPQDAFVSSIFIP
ncbi:NAD(P)-binding protein [Westerdykella ornata]|uniref:NAD(P)-binding protein n=1 Tax=Westerdykella ornata TaxID=318751 RepID=A0A6A6JGZ7_WESOR|nr:NAD(P)-binding protein [Westerdykella ornata]KAF2274906.1 NAD(P)-binding protein [Westerdykella ornata]